MSLSSPRRYLETQIMTASREQLLLMLYDGAIRFCEQAREALAAKDYEASHELLIRSQRILIELWCALNPDVDAQLSKRLGGLYSFLYLHLVHANLERDPAKVEEVIRLLGTLRQAWGEAVDKSRNEAASSIQAQG